LEVPLPVVQFDDVLHKVVAVGVLNQGGHVFYNYISQTQSLPYSPFLKASLHDAAPMLVGANLDGMLLACIEDERRVGLRQKGFALGKRTEERLDDMVSVDVECQLYCFFLELIYQIREEVLSRLLSLHYFVKHRLDSPCPMDVETCLD